jgi:hypothetical protein
MTTPMTGERMAELMRQIGWTSGRWLEVARRLGVRENSIP